MAVLTENPAEKEKETEKEKEESAAAESSWREVYKAAVLPQILAEFEEHDAATKKQMEDGMARIFDNPYVEELTATAQALSSKSGKPVEEIDLERARQIIFMPWPSDMRFYSEVWRTKLEAADENKLKRLRGLKYKLLSVFYTLHGKDNTLLERFVQHDGMEALASLLLEDNNIIQSQAQELMSRIVMLNAVQVGIPTPHRKTQETRFAMQVAPDVKEPRQLYAMNRLHACFTGDAFFPALQRILISPEEVFPNSHEGCLKLLTMSLNWLHRGPEFLGREELTPARPLRTTGKSTADLRAGVQNFLDGGFGRRNPDCQEIAEGLLAGGAPLLEAGGACDPASDPFSMLDSAAREAFCETLFAPETLRAEDASFASARLKAAGAEAFRAGRLLGALECYRLCCPFAAALFASEAPGLPLPARPEADREALLATLRSNEAAVLLKLERWEEALLAASAAADKAPEMTKAHYRRAEALLQIAPNQKPPSLGLWREADLAAARAQELSPGDKAVIALRARTAKFLEEAVARGLPEESDHAAPAASQATMDEMD